MPQFKAIIFDLDNTLLDFMKLKQCSCDAAITAMIAAGLQMKKREALSLLFSLYSRYGIEDHIIFERFLKKTMKTISYSILAAGIVAYRNVRSRYLVPYPHVRATLQKLKKQGMVLGILTDAPKIHAWMRIAALRLLPIFDHVVTFDDTKTKKPSPVPFKKMLQALMLQNPSIVPRTCLMVGDGVDKDIKGARAVGMKTCFAQYGSGKKTTVADYTIDDISDIIRII